MREDNDSGITDQRHSEPERSIKLANFDQYRSLPFSIAYRMLGSVADAEDMLQETFIRWQESTEQDVHSPRSFLVTIISRLCINYLGSTRIQREEYVGVWLPEPIVTDPGKDPFNTIRINGSLSIAFLVLLERLTPMERAVFLLREVFEYEYADISSILGQSEANCRQILKRAKHHVSAARPRFQIAQRSKDELLESFLKAVSSGEMSELLGLLSADVILRSDGGGKAVSVPNEVHGADKVARGIVKGLARLVPPNLHRKLAHINGEPGLINYLDGKPHSVLTIDVVDDRIRSIYIITNPEKLAHLPPLQ